METQQDGPVSSANKSEAFGLVGSAELIPDWKPKPKPRLSFGLFGPHLHQIELRGQSHNASERIFSTPSSLLRRLLNQDPSIFFPVALFAPAGAGRIS